MPSGALHRVVYMSTALGVLRAEELDRIYLRAQAANARAGITGMMLFYEGTFLQALEGDVAPANWRGQLPITYHVGGTDAAKVHIAVKSDWSLKTVYNVVAKLKGSTRPNEWVMRGNHRDGWVFGASDPLSGHVAMMNEAKALGALVKGGWKPARTIVYASWDAEEPMLLGSTEWAETHADELKKKLAELGDDRRDARGRQCEPAPSLDLLAEFGKTNQVLLFTHHRSVRALAEPLAQRGLANIIDLDRAA